ncbi:LysR substrate-binding domain-containing protein [Sphingomonas cannabina]|uniref:LysR substrate-binding domain-containing protein n=1 Tax=Sphingomonas cannabina TaxID=2899123 RepID=UPI001F2E8E51|nr:LysR substrate-binding domain-containing protein [Sphingomonas cannabina]UIJ45681.1 LysR substrate-binding domain-containing protein [Sphingomonas cannabina]
MSSREPGPGTKELPPRNSIPPFAALRAFDAVARLGGIRKAAQTLGLDHAVVSRHLRTLELWTGTVLLERARSGSALTPEGLAYHRSIAAAIDLISNATLDLIKASDDHQLKIWCMPGFASKWLLSRMRAFEMANSGMTIEVRPSDHQPDFNRHEADIDIRYAPTYGESIDLPPNVRTLELARPSVIPVASPAYLASAPPIARAADLLAHPLLHEENFENWRAWLTAHGVAVPEDITGTRLWHAHLTIDAACQGRGIALANHFLAVDAIEAGQLVELGGEHGPFEKLSLGSYLLIARTDRWSSPAIARFRRWIVATVAQEEIV